MTSDLWPASISGGKLERYFHVCALFSSPEEEYRSLLPFVREGLENREKALHIWDPRLREEHVQQLSSAGIGVESYERDGQLAILSTLDVYLQGGRFETGRMLETFESAIAEGKEHGYARMRTIGHMDWALEGHPGCSELLEFEIKVNAVLARSGQPAVCVYDVNKLSAKLMLDILRAHPLTIIGGVLHENPFFIPPDEYLEQLAAHRDRS